MTRRLAALGWVGAALASALLLGGTSLALVRRPAQAPLFLDLGQASPAAPAIAALAEAAPKVVDEAPDMAAPPAPFVDSAPVPPTPEDRVASASAPPITLPTPDVPTRSDQSVPEPSLPKPPVAEIRPTPAKPEAPRPPPKPHGKTTTAKASSAGSSAPTAGASAKGGGKPMSSAAYARAVMKKVRATRKQSGAGKGVVVVGFSIAANGGLARVDVIRSSGNAALDQIAVGHIRRAAPFPVPPEEAGRNFSFEFVGK